MLCARPVRLACLLAWAALAASGGCAAPSGRDVRGVDLDVWSMWSGHEEQNFVHVLRRYEATHPGVRIHNLGAVSDDTKTVRALVAGVPPDFFTLSDPSYLGPMARNGALAPLDGLFRHAGLKTSDFVPASLALCRYQGRLYGMPFLIDDAALIWDRRAFKEAGLDPDRPPHTLEELADYAVRLTKRSPDGTIDTLGLRPLGDMDLVSMLFGGRFVDPTGTRITADDPGNVAALSWYKKLVDRLGGIAQVNAFASGFGADQGANNPFFAGKVAMTLNGEWNPYWISRYAPKLDYGVAPMPPPSAYPERARSTWIGGNVFCIPKESKHPEEAWKFMVWMQSYEAQVMFARAMNNVPNQCSALAARELRSGAPFRRMYARFLDLADSPRAGYFPAMDVAGLYVNQLGTATDRVLFGEATPAAALRDVRIRVQRELDRP